jgi:hypothetical protein
MYQWDEAETLTAASLHFWSDHPAGSGIGVAPPRAWRLEYWDETAWRPVNATSPYTSVPGMDTRVDFVPVRTRCLRAMFDASTDGSTYAAVALQEWAVFSARARPPRRPSVKLGASPTCSA